MSDQPQSGFRVIATSLWRKKHPTLRFHACDIADVGRKIAATGDTVEFANLDLCGQVSQDTVDQIKAFLRTCPLEADYCLGITVAKGREGRALVSLMNAQRTPVRASCSRIRALCLMCGLVNDAAQTVTVLGEGTYVSGRHPMTWAVFRVERFDEEQLLADLEGEVDDCLFDVCARINGTTRDGERTLVFGFEPNYTLQEAVWELVSAFEMVDRFWAAPRRLRRKVLALLCADCFLSPGDWRKLIRLCRAERNRRRVGMFEAAA